MSRKIQLLNWEVIKQKSIKLWCWCYPTPLDICIFLISIQSDMQTLHVKLSNILYAVYYTTYVYNPFQFNNFTKDERKLVFTPDWISIYAKSNIRLVEIFVYTNCIFQLGTFLTKSAQKISYLLNLKLYHYGLCVYVTVEFFFEKELHLHLLFEFLFMFGPKIQNPK